jgi:hypothetical protein
MKLAHIICIFVHIYVPVVAAAPSFLGLCHKDWNCDATVKLYDGQETIISGWIENTFNRSCPCADTLLNDPRKKIIRTHLIQSPCLRNKRCGRYEALWGYTVASASRAALKPKSRLRVRFARILETFRRRIEGKDVTCYVSPCLECDLYEPSRRVLAGLVSDALPNCSLVDNPFRRRCLRGTICEKHGDKPRVSEPCIVDLDGTDGSTIDLPNWVARYKHCALSYYWEPWMNCIRGEFVDPRKRNCNYSTSTFEATKGLLCQYFYLSSDICLP